jgi:hypothetical protein
MQCLYGGELLIISSPFLKLTLGIIIIEEWNNYDIVSSLLIFLLNQIKRVGLLWY